MNRNELLNFFVQNYAPHSEVLCKLPFNIPINPFWSELQNLRKSRGTVLPLHNASGMPFWFCLTEKMISCSEILSEAARNNKSCFDPYRANITPALCEEMFFTSFLEGAQIDIDRAMAVINSAAEPTNIQEQMIRNNHKAVSAALKLLSRPIDDKVIISLSYYLTEEMAGNSDNYRDSDKVSIPAMGNEYYSLPTRSMLPQLMGELYVFLNDINTHPLIKAAVSHAFILATRPFSDGDERLARLVSYIILLRSGYDHFINISLSMVSAKESYGYFKNMREILRPSNDGDLTYFVEYYLETLVKAQKMTNNAFDQTVIENERIMATQAISDSRQAAKHTLASEKFAWLPKTSTAEKTITKNDSFTHIESLSDAVNAAKARIMEMTKPGNTRNHLLQMLKQGKFVFDHKDIDTFLTLKGGNRFRGIRDLAEAGVLEKRGNYRWSIYSMLPADHSVDLNAPPIENAEDLEKYIVKLKLHGEWMDIALAKIIEHMTAKNTSTITASDVGKIIFKHLPFKEEVLERGEKYGIFQSETIDFQKYFSLNYSFHTEESINEQAV